ncbi:DM DNA binding domain protein, partial [Ancylostoma duodenale]
RRPNCQRCAQHNVVNRLKGHKRACPFKECFCPKCQVVVERQKLMADQIKLRRRQKREKNISVERERTPAGNTLTQSEVKETYAQLEVTILTFIEIVSWTLPEIQRKLRA